jgi:asparaginyl-tRNA synthetase
VARVEVVGYSDNFPISKDKSEEFLMDQRHLWVRSQHLTNAFKVRSTVFGAVHSYFRGQGFYEVQAPIIQSTQCEGGSTLFEVDYFGEKAFLAQTWQLHAEALVFALEKIYDMAPSFRAERSKTSRHLTEYWHAEMEMAWAGLDDILAHAEGLISHICLEVAEKNRPELEYFERDPDALKAITPPFPRIKYQEALELLEEKAGLKVPYGKDLRTAEEEHISSLFDKPVIVTHYPEDIMAFYKPEDPEDPGKCLCFDMLATEGYGEIIGGSQRDTDLERLVEKLKMEGEDPAAYDWYLDLRRYGSVPHAGFGMGVERVVRWLLGLKHIKDAIPFPRTLTRVRP